MLAMTPEFDGVEDGLLKPLLINNDNLIDFIKEKDNREDNNVKIVLNSTCRNG